MKALKLALKIFAGLLILLIVLLVVAYFALTRWINPNDFKPQIIEAVQQATGRTAVLNGNIGWSFYPNLGIQIEDAALGNPPGFNQPTFATIESADLLLNWDELLEGKVQISRLILNGLQVHLITDGKKNNWTFPSTTSNTPANAQDEDQQLSFMLQEVELNNGTLTYDDNNTKAHYPLTIFNLSSPNFTLVAPMEVKASGNIMSDNLSGGFKIDSLFFDMKTQDLINLNNLAFSSHFTYVDNSDQNIPIVLDLSGNVGIDLEHNGVTLTNIKFALNQILNGTLNAKVQNFANPVYSGNIKLPSFALESLLNSFNQHLPNLPNKTQFANTSLNTNFAGSLKNVSLTNLALGFGNTMITGTINFNSFTPFNMNEKLAINQLDVADFADLKGAALPLQNVNLQGSLKVAGFDPQNMPSTLNASQAIHINNITLKGFDLATLLNNIDIIVNNIINIRKVSDAYSQIQSQLSEIENVGSINASNGKSTNLGSLDTEVVIANGVVTTPKLLLSGPLVKVTGTGTVNLNQRNVDYQLNSQVIASSRNIVKTLTIPYNIKGPFASIQQGVDWNSVNSQIVGFITGQITRTVTSVVTTVVSTPVEAVGGVAKGVAGVLSHIFGGSKASQS